MSIIGSLRFSIFALETQNESQKKALISSISFQLSDKEP